MKHVVSSAGETQPFSSAIFNENHTDLNARSQETESSDRARSNRDAINERRFRSIGLIQLNKRTALVVISAGRTSVKLKLTLTVTQQY